MIFRKRPLIFFILFFPIVINAQTIGAGGSLIYNPQTESAGFGLRAMIFPNKVYSIVPQFSYYPSFNKVHEFNIGLGLEYKFWKRKSYYIYVLGHGGYDSWINYEESPMKDAKRNNWNLEGGIGISTWRCLRPFFEYRYNTKFMETNAQLGLIYVFKCNSKYNPGANYSHSKSKGGFFKKKSCPAYN